MSDRIQPHTSTAPRIDDPAVGETSGRQRGRQNGETFQRVLQGGLQVARAVAPGGQLLPGGGAAADQAALMERVNEMQVEGRIFQLELLSLQEQIQTNHRVFSTMSNVIRARHDTARAAIQNIRA